MWVLCTEAVGALSGWLARDGMELYRSSIEKPPLSPPGVVFPIVWGILFALMGIGAARMQLHGKTAGGWFWVQLGFNFAWSLIFFRWQLFGAAFLWLVILWGLILGMILSFHRTDRWAARLQIPYLLWTAFAGYLNAGVWLLNR